jgi:hypothetical protein
VGEEPHGPGWTQGLDGQWFEDEEPAPAETGPPTYAVTAPAATTPQWADPGAGAPDMRFYAVIMIIAAPLFIGAFGLLGGFALSAPTGRTAGIVLTSVAVLATLFAVKTPYMAVVDPDGSLTFRAITGSKETNISRISGIGLSTGARGGSSWIFRFDGTTAALGDIGGRALARYVTERNPSVGFPRGRFGR